MRHTVHKLLWAWQYEKEEKWLNEMSAKGMQLVDVGLFRYTFEDGNCGEYTYRLEFLEHWPYHAESMSYIRFIEDTGAEHVASFRKWVYFRKKSSDGVFELYSDNISKIKHYFRIIRLLAILCVANLFQMPNTIFRFLEGKSPAVLIVIALQTFIVILFIIGCTDIYRKIRRLKKDKHIKE